MLYKLYLDKESAEALEPIPFKDLSAFRKKEENIEAILADNLFDILFEAAQLLPIFRERPRQPEADLYALNEEGDLIIFELKRGLAGADAVQQLLRYTQEAGQWTYNILADKYKSFAAYNSLGESDLQKAHQDAFQLERPLMPNQFNRRQHLRVIGNAADEKLIKVVDYWKRQNLSINFVPYRIYEINGKNYFEFFSFPYDWHTNPSEIKGVIFDTNASWNEDSVWEMMKKKRVAAYGGAKRFATYLQLKDIVFYSHKGYGIIAAATVISPLKKEGKDELYHDVKFLTPIPIRSQGVQHAMSFQQVSAVTGKSFFWARTVKVPYLSREESEVLLKELNKILS